jgi:hypothetical protein
MSSSPGMPQKVGMTARLVGRPGNIGKRGKKAAKSRPVIPEKSGLKDGAKTAR